MSLSLEEPTDSLSSISAELQSLQSKYKTTAQEDGRQQKLLALASDLFQSIQLIRADDQNFGDSIGIDVLVRINYDLNECVALVTELNQKRWCCCLSKEKNPRQDRMCAVVRIRLIEAIYVVRTSVIDARCSILFDDVKESNDLADVLTDISGRTAILDLKDSWESKATVQTSLLQLLHRIEKFTHVFTSGGNAKRSPDSNPKRIKTLQKFLSTPPGSMSAMNDYTQANRMLYDMATLGANLLSFTAKERLEEVAGMVAALKTARDDELRGFRTVLEEDRDGNGDGITGRNLISSEDEDIRSIAEYSVHYDLRVNNRLIAAAAMWSELQERLTCNGFLAPYFGNASGNGSEEVILEALDRKGGNGKAVGKNHSSNAHSQNGSTHGQSSMDGSSSSSRRGASKEEYAPTESSGHVSVNAFDMSPLKDSEGLPSSASPASVASANSATYRAGGSSEVDSQPRISARRRSDQQLQQPPRHRNSVGVSSSAMSNVPHAYMPVGVAAPPPRETDRPIGGVSNMMSAAASMSLPVRSSLSYPQEDGGGAAGMKAKLFGSMSSAASKAAGAASIASQKTRKAASIAAETTSSKVARAKEKLLGGNYSAIIDFDSDSSRSFY